MDDKKYGLSEAEYERLRQKYKDADEATKREVVNRIALALYDDIHFFAKKKLSGERRIAPTSITILAQLKTLGYFVGSDKLERYETVEALMRLFKRCVCQAMINKYREMTKGPVLTSFGGEEDGDNFDVPSLGNFQDDFMSQEIATKLYNILKRELKPDEFDILMSRYSKGESYADIAAALENPMTPDAVRAKLTRLNKAILRNEEVRRLREDYRGGKDEV